MESSAGDLPALPTESGWRAQAKAGTGALPWLRESRPFS